MSEWLWIGAVVWLYVAGLFNTLGASILAVGTERVRWGRVVFWPVTTLFALLGAAFNL